MAPELINTRTIPCTAMPGPFTSQIAIQYPSLPAPSFSIFSDGLVVDGLVSVTGSMPFLGTVTLGGSVPATGCGNVMYSCGNGEVGIATELPNGPVMSELVRSNPIAWNNAGVFY